ncbi:hypothetical protein [Saccharolobus islandicus]|uniref:hypothetical protein n=1 Tax=Saccharolobus islandicus TaxID=43080 RepID=UPI000493E168|nr:hypothetical protein [Sulfolobus islandicus]
MNSETHLLVLFYIFYISAMTLLVTMSYEFALKNKLGYFFLLISYISTAVYFVLFSLSDSMLSLIIVVYFWLIMQISYNLGKYKFAIVSSLIIQEILMSLLYYAIVRGSLIKALYSLYFYATDIPSFSLSISQIIIPAILEVVNSFMFFLMVFPEIAYLSFKYRNIYSLLLSSLIFAGPNIASEMTHSILPLPYDPIKESSILELLLSVIFTIYFSYKYMSGRINTFYYLLFVISSLSLSSTEFYYSLTINQVPYAIATLLMISMVFYYVDMSGKEVNVRIIPYLSLLPSISELFFGASVAYFYNVISAVMVLSITPFFASLFPIFYYYSHKS